MAPTEEEIIENIRKYAKQAHADQQSEMELDHDASLKMLDTRLDSTIEELQARVEEQREALDEVCYIEHSSCAPALTQKVVENIFVDFDTSATITRPS